MLERAAQEQVDLVIHAGDLFDSPAPSQNAIAAAGPLWELASSGIPVVIIPGNHERSSLPSLLLLAHPNIHVLQSPRTLLIEKNGLRVAVVGIPCIRRNVAAEFAAALHRAGWQPGNADINILAVHQTVEGARCGPGNYRFRAGEDVLASEAIPQGFDYIAAGHVHRHQALAGGPDGSRPIIYAGSPDRITFAEMGEPKGCVIVDFQNGRVDHRFLEHDVRPMRILPLDVTGLGGGELVSRLLAELAQVPEDAATQVRLTGQATRPALAGLELGRRLRELRPDGLTTVSFQAVEWLSERAAFQSVSKDRGSAFDLLDAPKRQILSCAVGEVRLLPDTCGTYALYDADGRLLYVGKAQSLSSRVRTHLRGQRPGNHFHGWTRQIARAEARVAASNLEAVLVEAELIRRLAPPFNRQMRLWKRYCYLCETGQPHGQLGIRPDPRGWCFGPLRNRQQAEAALEALSSHLRLAHGCPANDAAPADHPASAGPCQRYFAGRCAGPCGRRITPEDYEAKLKLRKSLLEASDLAATEQLEQELAQKAAAPEPDSMLDSLRALLQRARQLREGRELLNTALLLPGEGAARTVVLLTPRGLHLEDLSPGSAGAGRLCEWPAQHVVQQRKATSPALPKPVADVLCAAATLLRRSPGECEVLGSNQAPDAMRPASASGSFGNDGRCREQRGLEQRGEKAAVQLNSPSLPPAAPGIPTAWPTG